MKLHKVDNSPFAARVRMQIRYKKLDIELCEPSEALRTPEFRAAYPLAKIPALELPDGVMISESTVIMNYLEDCFPDQPMRPQDSLSTAHNEMMIRYVDNHLPVGLSPLFLDFFAIVRAQAKIDKNTNRFDALHAELDKLNNLFETLPSFTERGLLTGDLCLAAHLYYVDELASFFGSKAILEPYEQIQRWQNWVAQYPEVAESVAEMDAVHRGLVRQANRICESQPV